MSTTDPIRSKKQLKDLADYFLQKGELRNYVLIVMGTSTALRIGDLLSLCWDDVYDYNRRQFRTHITITEQKTRKLKTIALNRQIIAALDLYFPTKHSDFIFANNRVNARPISRIQAWRIIHDAAENIGVTGTIACHSLRKTWGYHAWIDNAVSPVVIMHIYNHSNYDTTKRYLGIAQDELDKAYLGMDLF